MGKLAVAGVLCLFGLLVVGVLAAAEDDDEVSSYIVHVASSSLPRGRHGYKSFLRSLLVTHVAQPAQDALQVLVRRHRLRGAADGGPGDAPCQSQLRALACQLLVPPPKLQEGGPLAL
jgi:hypothetical protein